MSVRVENLLIVIVLYKEKLRNSVSYKSLNKNLGRYEIFVYDNSPNPDNEAMNNPLLNYIHDCRNSGVSFAYNTAAGIAKRIGKEWLLLLDQDTELPSNFLADIEIQTSLFPASLLYSPKLNSHGKLISPSGYRFKRGYMLDKISSGVHCLNRITFLNSGLLISTELFNSAGGYANEVPLYFSDFVFINRLRRVIKTFVLLPINLNHSLSSNDESDIPEFKVRFNYFLDGAFAAFKSEQNGFISYYISTFLRSLKLSFKLKDNYYLFMYFKKIFNL